MSGLRLSRAVVGAAVALVVLAGCTSEDVATSEAQAEFDLMIEQLIDEAEAGGAGEAQIAILREAQGRGVVSMDDDRVVANAMIACVEDAGSEAFSQEQTTEAGLVRVVVNSLANTPEQMAISDACDTEEHFWVDIAYQMQPTSIAIKDAYLDQQVPLVRACLEREGYPADPEATTHEVLRQALDVNTDTASAVDCLAEAEIDGF